ncbi:MAG: hypothetical protein LV480_06965 [Methylacidiphilales bacterium]|nr:hypothetical protein [Candidatus Methylacidiphilales bacterium]
MKDMNRDELMELIATVSFRVMAFTYALSACKNVVSCILAAGTLSQLFGFIHSPLDDHYILTMYASGIEQVAIDLVTAIVLFRFAVPLARLITRGLSHVLEPKIVE